MQQSPTPDGQWLSKLAITGFASCWHFSAASRDPNSLRFEVCARTSVCAQCASCKSAAESRGSRDVHACQLVHACRLTCG
jgi:hypothetical protein